VGGFPVVRRPMRQWTLRITAYAERLLDELDKLDWPEGIKLLQRNWIGRSEGAEIDFKIDKSDQKIRVFTTRPDTLYGGTFLVLAPEHSLVDLIVTEEQWPAVREYRERTARKSDLERADLSKDKTGVFTGAYAINPANNEKIPIWIADYVLIGYGTGAIGGVPAHDVRDLEFAKKFDLPVVVVVQPTGDDTAMGFAGEGIAVNSPIRDGLTSAVKGKRLDSLLRNGDSRDERHAAMGRFVLVLLAILRSKQRSAFRGRAGRALLDGRREAGWCRFVRWRHRARCPASAVCTLLAKGVVRSWLCLEARAVPAPRQSGNHPG